MYMYFFFNKKEQQTQKVQHKEQNNQNVNAILLAKDKLRALNHDSLHFQKLKH